jgi:hypothetical protein
MKFFKVGDLLQINHSTKLCAGLMYDEEIQCDVGDLFLVVSDNYYMHGAAAYEILSVKTDRVLYWHKEDLHTYNSPYFSKIKI